MGRREPPAAAGDQRRPSPVSPYAAVAVRSFRRHATYRGATLAGVVTNTVFGFIYASVFAEVHERVGTIDGLDADLTATYVFTAQAFLAMTGAFGDREISERIRTGDIAADLHRPVDFQLGWLAHDLGKAAFQAIFRGVPPFLVGVVVLSLPVPADPVSWLAFLVAAVLGVVLAFGIRFLANLSGFWLLDARGVVLLAAAVQLFFAGHVVPLYFMPGWLQSLARALPFAGITAVPVEILLGLHRGRDLAVVYAAQLGWIAATLAAGRLMLAAAQRRLVVQGG
jgi:ABC-2 type transport system permease protein